MGSVARTLLAIPVARLSDNEKQRERYGQNEAVLVLHETPLEIGPIVELDLGNTAGAKSNPPYLRVLMLQFYTVMVSQ